MPKDEVGFSNFVFYEFYKLYKFYRKSLHRADFLVSRKEVLSSFFFKFSPSSRCILHEKLSGVRAPDWMFSLNFIRHHFIRSLTFASEPSPPNQFGHPNDDDTMIN